MSSVTEYKLVVLGEPGVGKSTFLQRHANGEFVSEYLPTLRTHVQPLRFFTNRGPLEFRVWDIGAADASGTSRDGILLGADCALLMFDLTCQHSYSCLRSWHRSVTRVCESVPTVVVGTKADLSVKKFMKKHTTSPKWNGLPYCELSSKELNDNFDKPFLQLARLLTQDNELVFVSCCTAGPPPELSFMTPEQLARYEADLAEARFLPLPDDDEDL